MVDILLVEDSTDEAEMTIRSLKKSNLGDRLVWLKEGALAIDFLFGQGQFSDRDTTIKPKVIFLDLKLPKVDGLEVLGVLKSNPTTDQIPVVMMTSSKEEKDIVKSYSLGVNSYIVKPVDFDKFSKAVSETALYWLKTNITPRNK
jgi:two-component system response regulator